MTSDKQVSFISTLARSRYQALGLPDAQSAVSAILAQLDNLDNRGASTLIDRLKALPEAADPTMPPVVAASPRKGVNSNTQPCSSCGHAVKAGEGYYYKGEGDYGKWLVHHKVGECVDAPAPAPTEVTEGFYEVGDDIIMVYKTSNNRLAGKVLNGTKYEYRAGAVHSCSTGIRLSAEVAAKWGKLHKRCIVCRRALKDEGDGRSLDMGYGPVCAGNNGWPWG